MRVGLQLPSFSWPGGASAIGPTLGTVAAAADQAGFASLWVMDHLFQLPEESWGGPDEPMLEAYTTLGFLAQATSRVRLGALVGAIHFREPGLLVKAVTTLDVLSGGRAYFGIGAGWYQREARGLGLPWPSRPERFARLEETLRFTRAAWSGDRSAFRSSGFAAEEPIVVPQPLSRPRPPIMVGGNGERRTLRLVAEYGDACNILVPDPGESRQKVDVLRRHCEAIGRDPAEIETTALIEVDLRRQRPTEVVGAIRAQAGEGIQHVIVNLPDVHEPARIETFRREIIPAVAGLVAAGVAA